MKLSYQGMISLISQIDSLFKTFVVKTTIRFIPILSPLLLIINLYLNINIDIITLLNQIITFLSILIIVYKYIIILFIYNKIIILHTDISKLTKILNELR